MKYVVAGNIFVSEHEKGESFLWVTVFPKPNLNRVWLWAIVMCAALFIFYLVSNYWFEQQEKETLKALSVVMVDKVMVIDPGHGGIDPGAIGINGSEEKEITLTVSKKLSSLLEHSGAKVIMTRETDTMYYNQEARGLLAKKRQDLARRVAIANENKADAFVSIHVNSFKEDSKQHGAQTFSQPGSAESKKLSQCIQTEMMKVLKNTDRKPKEVAGYFINKKTEMPAVIVEIGFASNPQEEKLLNDEEYQSKVAYSIYAGIVTFFHEKES